MSQNVFVINLLIVTWDAVGYYSNGMDRVGSCVMLYACMLYAAYLQHFGVVNRLLQSKLSKIESNVSGRLGAKYRSTCTLVQLSTCIFNTLFSIF